MIWILIFIGLMQPSPMESRSEVRKQEYHDFIKLANVRYTRTKEREPFMVTAELIRDYGEVLEVIQRIEGYAVFNPKDIEVLKMDVTEKLRQLKRRMSSA